MGHAQQGPFPARNALPPSAEHRPLEVPAATNFIQSVVHGDAGPRAERRQGLPLGFPFRAWGTTRHPAVDRPPLRFHSWTVFLWTPTLAAKTPTLYVFMDEYYYKISDSDETAV